MRIFPPGTTGKRAAADDSDNIKNNIHQSGLYYMFILYICIRKMDSRNASEDMQCCLSECVEGVFVFCFFFRASKSVCDDEKYDFT